MKLQVQTHLNDMRMDIIINFMTDTQNCNYLNQLVLNCFNMASNIMITTEKDDKPLRTCTQNY